MTTCDYIVTISHYTMTIYNHTLSYSYCMVTISMYDDNLPFYDVASTIFDVDMLYYEVHTSISSYYDCGTRLISVIAPLRRNLLLHKTYTSISNYSQSSLPLLLIYHWFIPYGGPTWICPHHMPLKSKVWFFY